MVPCLLVAGWIVPIQSIIMIISVLFREVMGLLLSFKIVCVIGLLLFTFTQRMFIPIVGEAESVLGDRWKIGKSVCVAWGTSGHPHSGHVGGS